MAAQAWDPSCYVKYPDGRAELVPTIKCLESMLGNVIMAVGSLAAVALLIMLFIGGLNFMFAAGDHKKLEKAQGTLTAAIIGIVVMACAFLLIKLVEQITGVKVTEFKIEFPT